MWFPTKDKVSAKIDALLNETEQALKRVLSFYEQDKIVGSILGPNDVALQVSAECKAVHERLIEAQAQVRFGMRSPREVSVTAEAASQILKINQKRLDQMERSNARGMAMADAYLGKN
jgi:hypothetical protein